MIRLLRNSIHPAAAVILFSLSMLTSCRKFVDVPSPEDRVQTADIFKDDQSAVSAITGLYNRMLTSSLYITNGGITLYCGLAADELYTTSPTSSLAPFNDNALLPNTAALQGSLWVPAYKAIYQANAILEGVEGSTSLTDSVARQVRGEALLIRALHYFYLVNLFGDVPLALSTDYEANSRLPRVSTDSIYKQIVGDLLVAKHLLNDWYPSEGRARANKYTAAALLSRVYLFLKDWTHAEAESSAVINSATYSLVDDLNSVFLINSSETIWQLASDITNTAEGATLIPFSAGSRPSYAVTSYLVNAFDPDDQRKNKWLKSNMINGQPFYYPYKYKSRAWAPITEYYIVLRLAEQFLTRAEARAELNNLTGALDDLNTIRSRAGLSDISSNDQSDVLSAIAAERRIELFSEWGHRWFDLKRTEKADAALSTIKSPEWQSTDTLFPIPLSQILVNPLLSQNAGY